MKKLKLCNVHKLAFANEGEGRKPIHIPFGTWAYDDTIDQTLDREHAEAIAADLAGKIAAGEPGIPVYQGHPDVPQYAGKYPDKGALGWIKKILVNEDGMDLEVEWDRDPGKGFGWFSPYWTGDDPGPSASGKRNVIVDGLTSVGLVNNPNIREFRLANEAGESLTQRRGEAEVAAFKLPDHLLVLAKRFDDRVALANVIDANGMGHSDENGQFDGSGSGGGGAGSGVGAGANRKTKSERATESFKRRMDEEGEVTELNELEVKYIKLSGGNPFDLSPEAEKALSDFNKKKADLQKRGIIEERIRGAKPGEGFRHKSTTDEMKRRTPVNMGDGRSSWTEEERKKFSDPTSHLKFVELAKRFDERMGNLANSIDANGMGHSDENGQFDGSGSGGGAVDTQPQAKEKLKSMLKSAAVSIDKGGRPTKDDVVFEYNHKMYYVGKDNEHLVKDFVDRGLVKRVRGYHNVFGPGDPKKGYRAPIKDSDMIPHPFLKQQETQKKLDALWADLAKRFDERRRNK